ncbi:MAG: SPOR domain-containing protein [Bacteroidota bacterium]
MTSREGNAWTEPRKLRDYIKMDGKTATQPFVTHIDDKEILYYVTNRVGGQGGMDIWYTTREIDSEDFDFTLPQNAGPTINTPGDEVTPYYDVREQTLYFSSNGHPSVGGLDVYKAKGAEENWEEAERLPTPFNSSADDYYFHRNKSGTGGFLVSNRLFDLEKIETTQDDIFTFSSPMSIPFVLGKLWDKENQEIMREVRVALYEIKDRGKKRLLNAQIFKEGSFEFGLLANRNYRLVATKRGYAPSTVEFNTNDPQAANSYQLDIELDQAGLASSGELKEPVFQQSKSQKLPTTQTTDDKTNKIDNSTASLEERPVMTSSKSTYTSPTNSTTQAASSPKPRYKRYDVSSDAPKHQGIYYKVQFTVVVGYNESNPIFDKVRDKGRLDTEFIKEKGWTRVLLADFFSVTEARRLSEELRQLGFPDAFIVKYRNGRRLSY